MDLSSYSTISSYKNEINSVSYKYMIVKSFESYLNKHAILSIIDGNLFQ